MPISILTEDQARAYMYELPTGERHCLNSVSLGFTPIGQPLPDRLQRAGSEAAPAA